MPKKWEVFFFFVVQSLSMLLEKMHEGIFANTSYTVFMIDTFICCCCCCVFSPEPHFLFDSSQVYDRSCYEGQLQSLDVSLKHVGGVFVEALSVCHTDLSGPSYSQQCWYLGPIKKAGEYCSSGLNCRKIWVPLKV